MGVTKYHKGPSHWRMGEVNGPSIHGTKKWLPLRLAGTTVTWGGTRYQFFSSFSQNFLKLFEESLHFFLGCVFQVIFDGCYHDKPPLNHHHLEEYVWTLFHPPNSRKYMLNFVGDSPCQLVGKSTAGCLQNQR